ncbi:hypothetical protein BKA93DRAFT_752911 [Sparassis latifolia]
MAAELNAPRTIISSEPLTIASSAQRIIMSSAQRIIVSTLKMQIQDNETYKDIIDLDYEEQRHYFTGSVLQSPAHVQSLSSSKAKASSFSHVSPITSTFNIVTRKGQSTTSSMKSVPVLHAKAAKKIQDNIPYLDEHVTILNGTASGVPKFLKTAAERNLFLQ